MTTLREAAQQALEALEYLDVTAEHKVDNRVASEAISTLRQALEAEQQEEPVGHLRMGAKQDFVTTKAAGNLDSDVWYKLYTHTQPTIPQGWKLVPEQITEAMSDAWVSADGSHWQDSWAALLAAAPKAPTPQAGQQDKSVTAKQQPLTDEQIRKIGNSLSEEHRFHSRMFAHAIERAHGIGGEA